MPLGKRRLDNQPRQEYFEDNSGAITLEIGFDFVHGVFLNEVFDFDQRRTRGQVTALLVEKLSRSRIAELSRKIADALAADNVRRGVPLRTEVDVLVTDLKRRVEAFILDPANLDKLTDTKASFVQIARALDEHRSVALQRQRDIVLGVLMNDFLLTQPRTFV